ncbi:MAG TPA: hypothetical protein VNI84_08640 [Pyrinomonadaceae bacterium]|nr:hypothetical protein [Pyrinomonadaceae bacterium]
MKKITFLVLTFAVFSGFANFTVAQTKPRKAKKPTAKIAPKVVVNKEPSPIEEPNTSSIKKNERPAEEVIQTEKPELNEAKKANGNAKSNSRPIAQKETTPVYFYTFAQPDFLVSKIFIEHDETGKGKISFLKKNFGDLITDPIQLSPQTLERVKDIFNTLNFLDSKETYQSAARNYAHLGTMTFAVKKDERARAVEFNWTENKDAKLLADEYRRIGQQFVWIFDMSIAKQNQTLETPGLMDALDSLIRRGEISDAVQMLPLLRELASDERLPLIARNHATRIVKEIEKKAEKK